MAEDEVDGSQGDSEGGDGMANAGDDPAARKPALLDLSPVGGSSDASLTITTPGDGARATIQGKSSVSANATVVRPGSMPAPSGDLVAPRVTPLRGNQPAPNGPPYPKISTTIQGVPATAEAVGLPGDVVTEQRSGGLQPPRARAEGVVIPPGDVPPSSPDGEEADSESSPHLDVPSSAAISIEPPLVAVVTVRIVRDPRQLDAALALVDELRGILDSAIDRGDLSKDICELLEELRRRVENLGVLLVSEVPEEVAPAVRLEAAAEVGGIAAFGNWAKHLAPAVQIVANIDRAAKNVVKLLEWLGDSGISS